MQLTGPKYPANRSHYSTTSTTLSNSSITGFPPRCQMWVNHQRAIKLAETEPNNLTSTAGAKSSASDDESNSHFLRGKFKQRASIGGSGVPNSIYYFYPIPIKGTTINDLGAEEIFKMNLFFPGNPFYIKVFSSASPLKIYFFLGKASKNSFCPRRGLSEFFFSCRRVFFLESPSQNFFFPWECLSKFIFSRKRASEFFFLIFSGPTPRSLMVVP